MPVRSAGARLRPAAPATLTPGAPIAAAGRAVAGGQVGHGPRIAGTIRRETRGSEVVSKRPRSGAEQEVLARTGQRIVVLEMQGAVCLG